VNTLTVTITVSTVHPHPAGGAIFTGSDQSGRWIRVVAGSRHIFRTPLKGEIWQLTGRLIRHQIYGDQLHVERASMVEPQGHSLVKYLIAHPAFRHIGLGQAKASRLYKAFGERLLPLLDEGDTGELSRVVSEETASRLVAAWQSNARESTLIKLVGQYGLNSRLLEKIVRYWPKDTIEKLRDNPYRLLVLTGWHVVDSVAGALGVAPDDERRLIAAAEAAVYYGLDASKDTLTDDASLIIRVRHLLRCKGVDTPGRAVDLAVTDGVIVGDSSAGYQPYGCALMERYLMLRFTAMVSQIGSGQLSLFNGASEDNTNRLIQSFELHEGIALNAEQRAAVHMAVGEPLSVLTGGAGVGKTTVLKAVHYAVERTGGEIVQMALAGRAAQRMREATGREAYTITAFLNQVRLGKIKLSQKHLVVIDESSMLDLMLMYRVVKVLPEGVRILLVGDPHQLPPIGPGLVFHKLATSHNLPVQELIRVHRQAESTGIPKVAEQVRRGEIPELPRFNGMSSGVTFLDCEVPLITKRLLDVVNEMGGLGEVQILGITKNRTAGVRNINFEFHEKFTSGRRKLHGWGVAETDPIIYTVNDYDRGLYNGSLGSVEEIRVEPSRPSGETMVSVVCDFDGREIVLSEEELGNVELAYAITTHKAQGSQFKRVVIPITRNRLLDRTLIYTALTRGIEQVVFVGDRPAFNQAIKAQPKFRGRRVGFSF
jgi:exodeoxyribonuclease V alpha subunit